MLPTGFNAFANHLCAKIMDDLNQLGQYPLRTSVAFRLHNQRAIDLDDVRCQLPEPVKIRVLATKVVNGHAETAATVGHYGLLKMLQVIDMGFQYFENHMLWLDSAMPQ